MIIQSLLLQQVQILVYALGTCVGMVLGGELPRTLQKERVRRPVILAVVAPDEARGQGPVPALPVMHRSGRPAQVTGDERFRMLQEPMRDLSRPPRRQRDLDAPRDGIRSSGVDVPTVLVGLRTVEGGCL